MIIGSVAIKHHFPDFPREPKDLDVTLSFNGSLNMFKHLREEVLPNPVLDRDFSLKMESPLFCTPDVLYTLKISHCFWDLPNNTWKKHVWDVNFLKEKGCKFIPELFYDLFSHWEKFHGKRKSSNLDMTATEFFDNALDYPIKHDHMHELLITHPYFEGQQKPTYIKILKEGAEVDVCMEKFDQLSEKEKLNVVFEEISIMSLERYSHLYWKAGYERMLKKFILSHCKLEEGIWIIQNHKQLLTKIPFNFKTHFRK